MNTTLLKLGRRHRTGSWRWHVPGFDNGITYCPSVASLKGWGPSVQWPRRSDKGAVLVSVDLGRHRKLAKAEIRKLLHDITLTALEG